MINYRTEARQHVRFLFIRVQWVAGDRLRNGDILNLIPRAFSLAWGRWEKALGSADEDFDLFLVLNNSCKSLPNNDNLCIMPKSKWRKVCPLRHRFLIEIQFADSVVILMRVVMYFKYSAKLVHQKFCAIKSIKPMAQRFWRTIRGQRCYVGVVFHS